MSSFLLICLRQGAAKCADNCSSKSLYSGYAFCGLCVLGQRFLPKKLFVRDVFGLGNANEAKFGAQTDGIILNIFKGN